MKIANWAESYASKIQHTNKGNACNIFFTCIVCWSQDLYVCVCICGVARMLIYISPRNICNIYTSLVIILTGMHPITLAFAYLCTLYRIFCYWLKHGKHFHTEFPKLLANMYQLLTYFLFENQPDRLPSRNKTVENSWQMNSNSIQTFFLGISPSGSCQIDSVKVELCGNHPKMFAA